jgi:hypothetical protein
MLTELDRDVRLALFDLFVELGQAPEPEAVAVRASVTVEEVRAPYERLHDQRVIVLDPSSRDVWMANPFSAIPTPFRARIGERSWFGNCIWDGLGIWRDARRRRSRRCPVSGLRRAAALCSGRRRSGAWRWSGALIGTRCPLLG